MIHSYSEKNFGSNIFSQFVAKSIEFELESISTKKVIW